MNYNVLLGSSKHRGARNETNMVPIDIVSTYKPVVNTNIKRVLDQYEVYREEYSNCKKFRLTLTIKPYCSNVLFNVCTEIVKGEGSSDCIVISDTNPAPPIEDGHAVYGKTDGLYRNYMVENTEYSSQEIGYDYLPGYDIFNNHTLRNLSFRPIIKVCDDELVTGRSNFNTINDYMRDNDGKTIVFFPRYSEESVINNNSLPMHVYTKDNLLSFIDNSSFESNLTVKNGWYGFVNASAISCNEQVIPFDEFSDNGNHVFTHTINNLGNCEFVDMFPGRDRYSFVPKFNPYRKRYEKNWDIYLTYPFKKFYEHNLVCNIKTFNVNGGAEDGDKSVHALATMRVWRDKTSTNRDTLLFRTFCKHNLSVNDKIVVFLSKNNGRTYEKLQREYMVDYVGDVNGENADYFFGVSTKTLLNDVFYGEIENTFYQPITGANITPDYIVSNLITEVPTKYTDKIICVYVYVIDEQPLQTYIDEWTYDNIPMTVNQSSYTKIRVWNKNYDYMTWDYANEQYVLTLINQNIDYGDWNTYTDVPLSMRNEYIRVKKYDFYEKKERYFEMKAEEPNNEINDKLEKKLDALNGWDIRFAKIVNNVICDYYIREFRKLPNFKFASESFDEKINDNKDTFEGFIERNCVDDEGKMIEFDTETYKLAFSKTLYGDDVAQVTFLDDIVVQNLTDNLGRPVTDIYSTIIKRNKGYKTWYENMGTPFTSLEDNEDVEYSRCFGSLITGFEYLDLDTAFDRNYMTRRLKGFMSSVTSLYRNDREKIAPYSVEDWDTSRIENEISEEDFFFYGDVVEYCPVQYKETILSNACIRFNTAQREIGDDSYGGDFDFTYTEIKTDDFDPQDENRDAPFEAVTYKQWEQLGEIGEIDTQHLITVRRNEGYFYSPHTKIPLLKYSDNISQSSHRALRVKKCYPIQCDNILIKVTTETMHGVGYLNTLYLCDGWEWVEVEVCYVIDNYNFTFSPLSKNDSEREGTAYIDWITICKNINDGKMKIRVKNDKIPKYADRVDNNSFIWREIINPVALPEGDRYKFPFANGSYYVDCITSVYLRRQDPIGINGLYTATFGEIGGNVIQKQNNVYKKENEMICY